MKEYQVVYLECSKCYRVVSGKKTSSNKAQDGLSLEEVVAFFKKQPDIKTRRSLVTLTGSAPEMAKIGLRKYLEALSPKVNLII